MSIPDILTEYDKDRELDPEIKEAIDKTFDENSEILPSKNVLKPYFGRDSLRVQDGSYIKSFFIRDEYLKHCFVVYTHELIKSIVAFMKLNGIEKAVELCSGTGWLSHWLNKYGAEVKATDNKSWPAYRKNGNFLAIVKKQDAIKAVKANRNAKLFILSWPYMDETATRIWKAMKPGQMLLYIGESGGGCTASDSFFEAVYTHEIFPDGIDDVKNNFLQFYGIYDKPRLFLKQ